ncbi:MAG TPA: histidinol-phosphate transaminase [Mycobacteriales bacterium]
MSLDQLPLRDDLRGRTPYGAPQLDVAVQANTNENPYPPSAALVEDLTRSVAAAAAGLNRYPDRDAVALRTALAGYLGHGLDVSQVWAANGSNEVIAQVLQAFGGPGRRALGFEPSYSMHPEITRLTGASYVSAERAADFTLDGPRAVDAVLREAPDVTFLARPNNPTGTGLALDVVADVCAATSGMVVVDEAYAEFSADESALALLPRFPRLIVTRTMSKAFALAGGRVGYLAASPAVVDALQLVRLPYHLSATTQAAALAALRHSADTLATVRQVVADRDILAKELVAAGFPVAPSDANFLLVGGLADAARTWQALLDEGVLVRDVGIPGHLRITVGTTDECAAILAAWTKVTTGGARA